ncbi:MAG: metallophosphoesterase [Spirochaetes bacterium]|nr:metallophosphoesterase [Spirochaetota bacterium]
MAKRAKFTTISLILLQIFQTTSIQAVPISVTPHTLYLQNFSNIKDKNILILWALSDIQPKTFFQRWHFEKAIEDINKNVKGIGLAIVAGDIAHHRESEDDFRWYISAKAKSYIPHWFEIAGNHDMKDEMNYRKYIRKKLHYAVSIGNLLLLFMSDEDRFPAQKISDETFRWWENKVVHNQHRIIITITHAYLKQSGLLGYPIPSRNITDSERFAAVLEKHRVALWICGHTHLPGLIWRRYTSPHRYRNTTFINVSAIRKSWYNDIESNLIYFTKGESTAIIRRRNHEKEKFIPTREIKIPLGIPFVWDGLPPKLEND